MRGTGVLALVLLTTSVFAQSQNKKKPTVPAILGHAQYVLVESMQGDIFTPGLLPEDRYAILDVEKALREWGRYTLVAQRKDAELIFVVRSGRIAEGRVGGGVGNAGTRPIQDPNARTQPRPWGAEVVLGGGVGSPDDVLQVVMGNNRETGTQVWFRSEKDGLAHPDIPLFMRLKKAIDQEYPR